MTVIDKYIEKANIENENLHQVIISIFNFTKIKTNYKRVSTVNKKEEMVDEIISLLEKYLELDIVKEKSQKLEIIDVLDKLHFRKEVLEVIKSKIEINDIKKAGNRLGKKSQSAF
jgi:hypothetical protein